MLSDSDFGWLGWIGLGVCSVKGKALSGSSLL